LSKKIIYISDYFIEHALGGAEINDSILLDEIIETETERIQSHMVSLKFLKKILIIYLLLVILFIFQKIVKNIFKIIAHI